MLRTGDPVDYTRACWPVCSRVSGGRVGQRSRAMRLLRGEGRDAQCGVGARAFGQLREIIAAERCRLVHR